MLDLKQNGSGNDGNTARIAFANYQLFSSITSFDQQFGCTCSFVDVDKFKTFCKQSFLLHVNTYPWYPMSPTVHKILIAV